MIDVIVVFYAIAVIMLLSFIGEAISRKILLPSMILLIALGIICGPLLQIFDYDSLKSMVPILAPLTIAFIGFESGLKMDFYEVVEQSRRAIMLSVLGFAVSLTAISLFLHFAFSLEWIYALMLASAWSGVNTATVEAVCNYLRLKEGTRATLIISSLVDDAIVIVATLTILNYILLEEVGVSEGIIAVSSNFCISIFIGIILGFIWMNLLYFSRKVEYTYTFTLAALLLVYSLTETFGGTGGIAAFLFGVVLGNSGSLASALKLKLKRDEFTRLSDMIEHFHSELTFIIRSFFFTFIGLIYVFAGINELILGLGISLLLHLSRFIAVNIGTIKSPLRNDLPAIGVIVGKGVAAAAMSTLPLAYNLPNASFFTSIALNVILFTNVVSILLPLAFRKKGAASNLKFSG
ncbi:MAG TPA: hypothetical protein ENF63_00875 [Candidatus Bathyarchaeota archaeon]|nr:hypothetical protein [Candidatus Bathyarchaeota archaeon]